MGGGGLASRLLPGSGWREFLSGPLAVVLLLITPFVAYASFHGYSLFATEILVCIAILALVGFGLGVVVSMTTGVVQGLVLALITTLAIDLCWTGESSSATYATFAAACVVIRLFQSHIRVLVTAMCLAALSANAFVQSSEALVSEENYDHAVRADLPPVIHLILDEYMSVDALPDVVDGDLRQDTIDFFTSEGFRLFGGAYSQYYATYNSIGNTLNYSSSDIDGTPLRGPEKPFALGSSAYFEGLARKGYGFRVYQSSFLDYCRVPEVQFRSCTTYAAASIKYVEGMEVPSNQRAEFILSGFWGLSNLRRVLRASYNKALTASEWAGRVFPRWGHRSTTFGTLPALDVFDRLSQDVTRSSGGEVFFAHLLIPHSSYLLDERCVVRSDFEPWRARLITEQESDRPHTEKSRQVAYEGYAKQLQCTNRLLSNFFARLKASGHFDRATIIIHGDHGSRINLNWPVKGNEDQLVESDFIDGFPSLFAVKGPGVEAGYVGERATLSALLAETMGVSGPDDTRIFLSDGWGKPMLPQSMPDSWMRPERLSSVQ